MQTDYERSVAAHQAKMAAGWTAPLTDAEIEGVRSGGLTLGVTGPTRFLATIDRLRSEVALLREKMNLRYWEGVHAENEQLRAELSRVRSKGSQSPNSSKE